ncbi:hypothetical protein [Magnetospirillum moscoviense]|uniref:4Fe4S-binding SPASM domain-containing protein n=1 Tax=Magnetospirillum moscoviense TaxID=1437059 RepID=A0A178MZR2_9PROT|nr:hypothetical protein [Magnetospirillum moscoviense]OAN67322.1 hypothetical protein A6A05_18250 [Magnetospirillum moscoviense]
MGRPRPDYFRALEDWRQKCQGANITVLQAANADENGLRFHSWAEGKQRAIDLNKCYFLKENAGVVLWDGRIVSCCLDCHGECVIGNIQDAAPETLETVPWRGCRVCVFN